MEISEGQVAPAKKTWATSLDILLLDTETASKSSPERTFIYVLMLNTPNEQNKKPYYVGVTDNLEKRLSNHKAVKWHRETLEAAPYVWIAGTVPLTTAELSAEDLKNKLRSQGYLLYQDMSIPKSKRIDSFLPSQVQSYNSSTISTDSVIQSWSAKWSVKKRTQQKLGQRRDDESYITHMQNTRLPNPSKETLVPIIRKKKYKVSGAVLASQKLASSYDSVSGEATYAFKGADNPRKQQYLLEDAKKVIEALSSDWQLTEPLELRKPLTFVLTVNIKREAYKK